MDLKENIYCTALCTMILEGKKKTFLIKKGYLSNFHRGSCGIKILYRGVGSRY